MLHIVILLPSRFLSRAVTKRNPMANWGKGTMQSRQQRVVDSGQRVCATRKNESQGDEARNMGVSPMRTCPTT